MAPLGRLISGGQDGDDAGELRQLPQHFAQGGCALVAALGGAQAQHENQGQTAGRRQQQEVFDPHHNVILLVGLGAVGQEIEIPEVPLGRAAFHNAQAAGGGGPEKGAPLRLAGGGHPGQEGAVAVLVPGGDQGEGILGGQGGVEFLLGEGAAVGEGGVGEAGEGGGFSEELPLPLRRQSLIPDAQDAGAPAGGDKQRAAVVDAGVHEADHHPLAAGAQGRLGEDGQDACRLQGGCVQQGV